MLNAKFGVGVVEDRNDPLKVGRLRVRIIHIHDDDKVKLPTNKIPWAQVLHPVNAPRSFASPKIGDWVLCTFLDGMNGQEIIVMGVLPGLLPSSVKKANTPASKQVGTDGPSLLNVDGE
jgi:hypothetical protein